MLVELRRAEDSGGTAPVSSAIRRSGSKSRRAAPALFPSVISTMLGGGDAT